MRRSIQCILVNVLTLLICLYPRSILSQDSYKGRIFPINGINMYFEIHGQGQPVVMLHGWGLSHEQWNPYIQDLSKQFQLIIPDLRGHGQSTNSIDQFTFEQSAEDIFALIDYLGIDQIKGIGFSGGAMTLIHMATLQSARVEAMILMSGAHYWPKESRLILNQSSPDSLTEEQWEMIIETNNYSENQARWILQQFYKFKDSYRDMNFTPPYLSTITARTLIFHGDRDNFFPLSIPVELFQSIPNSYLWILPNFGHSPLMEEDLALFLIKAQEFLSGDWEN